MMKNAWAFRVRPPMPVWIFFAVVLIIGVLCFRDYGLSWDEPNMFLLGQATYETVFHHAPWITDSVRCFHGPFFEFLLFTGQQILHVQDARNLYFFRHAATYLCFFLGVIGFYALAGTALRSWRWGLLGAAMFVLSPRIFAHSFYNSRDIPNLVFFLLSIVALRRFLDRKTPARAIVLALACALDITVRLTGILLPVLAILFFAHDAVRSPGDRRRWPVLLLFALTLPLCVWLLWPLLWSHPLQNFAAAFHYMSAEVPAGGLYFGRIVRYVPWHYVPVWIFLTTPILYTVLFLSGLLRILVRIASDPRGVWNDRDTLLFLLWFWCPILSILFLHAGIYDEWRHVLFLYPAFLLIALQGLQWMAKDFPWRLQSRAERGKSIVVFCMVAVSMASTGLWMVRNHPFENLYFTVPAQYVEGYFELDYWGLSYRNAFEYLLAHTSIKHLRIAVTSYPGEIAPLLLRPADRQRIEIVRDPSLAHYVIDNFRLSAYSKKYPAQDAVYSVMADGITAITVYRMH